MLGALVNSIDIVKAVVAKKNKRPKIDNS